MTLRHIYTTLAKSLSVVAVTLLSLTSCGDQPKIIPDDELAQIFCEAYLQNAFVMNYVGTSDTLDIYTPIFAKYGYNEKDVRFTIGNFSKRKSAKLSDVVDKAIILIEEQRTVISKQIAVRDTLHALGRRLFARTVRFDSVINVRRKADTSRLTIRIPIDEKGEFEVSYKYVVDSVDKNHNMRTRHYIINHYGNRQGGESSHRMRRNSQRGKYNNSFKVEEHYRELVLDLNPYNENMTDPKMRIDSLKVVFYMSNRKAMDSLTKLLLSERDFWRYDYLMIDSLRRADSVAKVLADSLLRADSLKLIYEKDSLTLGADSARLGAE